MASSRTKLFLLAGVFSLCEARVFAASSSGTFPVSAVVLSSCSTLTLNNVVFPNYDVFASGALSTTATFQFFCTKGTTFASVDLVAASGAVGSRKMVSGADSIAYELYQPSGDGASATCPNTAAWGAGVPTGVGKGYKPATVATLTKPNVLKVCAVKAPQGADISAGTYVDSETLNINYN